MKENTLFTVDMLSMWNSIKGKLKEITFWPDTLGMTFLKKLKVFTS